MTVRTSPILHIANPRPAHVARELAVRLLEAGRYKELHLMLTEQRRHHPYDMELIRSVRVLEWYFAKNKQQTPDLAA